MAIREQGGLKIGEDLAIMPEPILMGRNDDKLSKLARLHGDLPWSTDLDTLLGDEQYGVAERR